MRVLRAALQEGVVIAVNQHLVDHAAVAVSEEDLHLVKVAGHVRVGARVDHHVRGRHVRVVSVLLVERHETTASSHVVELLGSLPHVQQEDRRNANGAVDSRAVLNARKVGRHVRAVTSVRGAISRVAEVATSKVEEATSAEAAVVDTSKVAAEIMRVEATNKAVAVINKEADTKAAEAISVVEVHHSVALAVAVISSVHRAAADTVAGRKAAVNDHQEAEGSAGQLAITIRDSLLHLAIAGRAKGNLFAGQSSTRQTCDLPADPDRLQIPRNVLAGRLTTRASGIDSRI